MQTLNENEIFQQIASEIGDVKETANQSGMINRVLAWQDELSILNKDLLKSLIRIESIGEKDIIYICSDKITLHISKKGYISPKMISNKRTIWLKGTARQVVLETMYKTSEKGKTIKLGSILLEEIIYNDNKYYASWNGTKLAYIMTKIRGEELILRFEKSRLKSENKISHKKQPHLINRDEVYKDNEPEEWLNREPEMTELLQYILELRERKISLEERELLKEIYSEISNLL